MNELLHEIGDYDSNSSEVSIEQMLHAFLKKIIQFSFDLKTFNTNDGLTNIKKIFTYLSSEDQNVRKLATLALGVLFQMTNTQINIFDSFGLIPLNGKILITPSQTLANLCTLHNNKYVGEVVAFLKNFSINQDLDDPIIVWTIDINNVENMNKKIFHLIRQSELKQIIEDYQYPNIPDPNSVLTGFIFIVNQAPSQDASIDIKKKGSISNVVAHCDESQKTENTTALFQIDEVPTKKIISPRKASYSDKGMTYAKKAEFNKKAKKNYQDQKHNLINKSLDSNNIINASIMQADIPENDFVKPPCEQINSLQVKISKKNSISENRATDHHSPQRKSHNTSRFSRELSPKANQIKKIPGIQKNSLKTQDKKKIIESQTLPTQNYEEKEKEAAKILQSGGIVDASPSKNRENQSLSPEKDNKTDLVHSSSKDANQSGNEKSIASKKKSKDLIDRGYFRSLQKLLPKNFESYSQAKKKIEQTGKHKLNQQYHII